eukprot:CAMPEP_0119493718 /NCGR_PEP_ID=MMETSP1344-20130328/17892_1 /TAXON_ID=236787 /ORGANISM="Florenciella parvula, Strain CCMP2471" /LENGTH=210 /DNA_ID=CAMNT_0007529167 /DNA_START=236 /DNA_END=865 /DNA_ORIENTATION=+
MPGDSGDSVGRRCGTEGPGGPTLPRAYSQGLLGDGWDLSIGLMVADETRGPLATACAKAKKPAIVASTTEHDIVSSVTLASAVITATKAAAFAAAAAPTGTNIGFGATVASRATNLWCADATPFHRTSEHHARLRGAANDGFGGACTHAKGRGSGGIFVLEPVPELSLTGAVKSNPLLIDACVTEGGVGGGRFVPEIVNPFILSPPESPL